ncbi:MAG: hypothetical protein C0436_01885 [Alphaproteobacteria bacterium]|jgi:hypothetical protein|nr:hypothetical protein [Alphaproteobacteria bacterium]
MMRVMKKVILSLFIALSLLVAPIAHAAGMNCEGDNCQMTEQSKKQSKSEKQDDGKMANAGHHCCCPHVSSIPNLTVAEPMKVSSRTVFVLEQDATTSVVVGPPLKPPSHA